jgi:hypothetical protein
MNAISNFIADAHVKPRKGVPSAGLLLLPSRAARVGANATPGRVLRLIWDQALRFYFKCQVSRKYRNHTLSHEQ